MRKPFATSAAAKKPLIADNASDASLQLICLALVLAFLALASRIAATW